ncbi:MAG: hypothetical protein WBP81_14690 [Solirubrobacteraceae bacterium]
MASTSRRFGGVIGAISNVLTAARRHGIQVVYLKMGFQPDLSDAGPPDTPPGSSIYHSVPATE